MAAVSISTFEQKQRARLLAYIVWTVLVVSVILGFFDIQFNTWVSVIALFSNALLCIPILILNARGRFYLAAILLSLAVLVVITVNIYDGNGVRDPGILGYPVFIMVGTLMFGKRAVAYFALAAIGSLALIVFLEFFQYIHPHIGPTKFTILIPMGILLLAAAFIIWVIVDNLEKNLVRAHRSETQLRENNDVTLEAWAKVMEYRDRETEGHSRRLVELSTLLGKALGLPEAEITHLRRGALLHDIGKLAIADEILFKPGALDATELRIMQRHPVYAKQMLSDIPFLEPSICVAYSHHERWDGRGYPDGLRGEEIPLLARIFTVVDTWDALRSDRVYRPAWTAQQAVAYLTQNSGIIYDARIVHAFLELIG
jgi:hypothetical protein